MHLDKYGLPVQANGDANDQLQRCGMIATAAVLTHGRDKVLPPDDISYKCSLAIGLLLQPTPGMFTRYVAGPTDTVSADQLIAPLGAFIAAKSSRPAFAMFKACIKRFGFAQNTKDGLNEDSKWKIPDFMLARALPLFARMHWSLYPVAIFADILLILLALAAVGPVLRDGSLIPQRRSSGDVDDNNTLLTLAVCRARYPTPLSIIALRLFARLRPWNYGCTDVDSLRPDAIHPGMYAIGDYHRYDPVYGALRWYHRAEAGGNPEIAELWKPICDKWFRR